MEPEGSSPHSQILPPLSTLRQLKQTCSDCVFVGFSCIPLNAELNSICHLLALLGDATIVVVSRLRVKDKVVESKIWFEIFTEIFPEIFLILTRCQRDIIITVRRSSYEAPYILVRC